MQSKDHKHQLLFSVKTEFAQSHLTLCDPLDDTVHRILQARILQWVAVPQPRDRTHGSWMAGGFFTNWVTRESQVKLFPLDSEPGRFACRVNVIITTLWKLRTLQEMVLYPYIPLPSFQSGLRKRSWQTLFCFLKNSSSTSSALALLPPLPWQDNHMQNQNKLFNYKDLMFLKEKPLRMDLSERMDNLTYYKCEHKLLQFVCIAWWL